MQFSLTVLAALAASAVAMPQGVTEKITPQTSAPDGCQESYPAGKFQITVVNVTSSSQKRDLEKRQQAGILTLTLADGVLTDQAGRQGYIASNFQFQFDSPPQAGAIFTAGFSACSNGTLALGGSAVFYQCYSGGFYNLYDRHWADQCSPIYLSIINGGSNNPPATQQPDGQPGVSTIVSQLGDGQPIQTTVAVPVTELPDGQPQGPTGAPVQQIPDGQPQGPTGKPVQQIPDGQPQGPTGKPVQQIPDGQPQGPTGNPVSQISDGQPQATPPPVSQISDGQIQATQAAPNATFATPSPPVFTGAAVKVLSPLGAIAAGVMGLAALL